MTGMETQTFKVPDDKDNMRYILRSVFDALNEKGYNPINQIVGYLLTEDPTYITNYGSARSMICKIDRDELMQVLVREYLFKNEGSPPRGFCHGKSLLLCNLLCNLKTSYFLRLYPKKLVSYL